MRRPRSKLQVSMFPFLAVLLCVMGALLLILFMMDHRAKIVAQNQASEMKSARLERSKAEEEARQAEWEKAKQALHQLLLAKQNSLKADADDLEKNLNDANKKLEQAKLTDAELKKKMQDEGNRIAHLQVQITTQQNGGVEASKKEKANQAELLEAAKELADLEFAFKKLRALKQNEKRTYSLVPYRGKHGDLRPPIYVECVGEGVLFHPEKNLLSGIEFTVVSVRNEVERRAGPLVVEKAVRKDKKHAPAVARSAPYVLFLVRPDGIENYYKAQSYLKGYQLDFGYELVDQHWALDFGAIPKVLPPVHLANASGSSNANVPSGPRFPGNASQVNGNQGGGNGIGIGNQGSVFGNQGGGNGQGGGGMPGNAIGPPPGLNQQPGIGFGNAGMPGRSDGPYQAEPYANSPAGRGGFGTGRSGDGSGGSQFAPRPFSNQLPGTNIGSGGGGPSGSGGNGPFGSGPISNPAPGSPTGAGGPPTQANPQSAPGSRPVGPFIPSTQRPGIGIGYPTPSVSLRPPGVGPGIGAPSIGSPTTRGNPSYNGINTGIPAQGPSFVPLSRIAPPIPVATTGNGLDAGNRSMNPNGSTGGAGATSGDGNSPGNSIAGKGTGSGNGTGSPAPPPDANAGNSSGAPMGGSAKPLTIGPVTIGMGSPAPPAGNDPVNAPYAGQPGGSSAGSDNASGGGSPPSAGGGNGGAAEIPSPAPPFRPLPNYGVPAPKRKTTASPAPPIGRILGNKDFIITIECYTGHVSVFPGGMTFRWTAANMKATDQALVQGIANLIAKRQASVRVGEPPYRPVIHFRVSPDGLRSYYQAYPLLERLGVAMRRENIED